MATIKGQDMMQGYAMLERPKRKVTREGQARSFEVFDTETLTKEIINIEESKPKVSKKKKPANAPKTVMDTVEPKGLPEGTTMVTKPEFPSGSIVSESGDEKEDDSWDSINANGESKDRNEYELPELRYTVKVYTDITEVSIEAVHVYKDENVVCIFMDKDDKTKLKPKKGVSMDIEVLGDRMTVYSPGVYIPSTPFGCDIVFLLVQNEQEE